MRKYLITGIVILLPITLSLLIFIWLIDLLTEPFIKIAQHVLLQINPSWDFTLANHSLMTTVVSRILVILFLFFVTLSLGFLARKYFFSFLIRLTNKLFLRIPIIKVIYKLTQDMTKAMFNEDQKPFKETAIVPFPSPDSHAIGLVTGHPPDHFKKGAPEADLVVFVPTSPHPISGFLLLCPKKYVKPLDVSTEDAFKFIISCGVLPMEHAHTQPQAPRDAN
jgi:uncharacterized membrane protein